MRHVVPGLSALAIALILSAAAAAQEIAPEAPSPQNGATQVAVVPIEGEIAPGLDYALKRRIERAKADGADLILIEVDSPGGRLDICETMCNTLTRAVEESDGRVRTAAYVKREAISAAAIIAIACQQITMNRGTRIGDAQAVYSGPGGAMEAAPEKIQTYVRSIIRPLAERNGYPVLVCEAMNDADLEVIQVTFSDGRVEYMTPRELEELEAGSPSRNPSDAESGKGDQEAAGETTDEPVAWTTELVIAEGKLLTLSASEAERFDISSGTFDDISGAIEFFGGSSATTTRYEANWSETMVQFLNSMVVSGLLMTVGFVALYIALKTPGFGPPEIVAIGCFTLLFLSKYLVGLAEEWEVLIFVAGVALLYVEIFVTPGFGVVGVTGVICVVVSLVLALQGFVVPDMPGMTDALVKNLITVLTSLCLSVVGFVVLLYYLPTSPAFKPLILGAAVSAEEGYVAGLTREEALIGKEGIAMTPLRPAGKAEIEGRPVVVVADGEFIEPGERIIVQDIRGNRVMVGKKA